MFPSLNRNNVTLFFFLNLQLHFTFPSCASVLMEFQLSQNKTSKAFFWWLLFFFSSKYSSFAAKILSPLWQYLLFKMPDIFYFLVVLLVPNSKSDTFHARCFPQAESLKTYACLENNGKSCFAKIKKH